MLIILRILLSFPFLGFVRVVIGALIIIIILRFALAFAFAIALLEFVGLLALILVLLSRVILYTTFVTLLL